MMEPPPQGNPFELLPPGIGNPEAWGNVLAWNAFQALCTQAMPDFLAEMQLIQGVAI